MSSPAPSSAEAARLRVLDRYQVLDTPREADFDGIAALAAEICGTPIAVVNLTGDGRQLFRAEIGLGVRETPFEPSFCRQALLQEESLYVPDAIKDLRFNCNPLVTGEPGFLIRAVPLRDEQGTIVGWLGNDIDIQDRREAEEHQKLLTNELQHRVKNTLAMVQSIASQTLRNAATLDEARDAFQARLIALGKTHDILTQSSWTAAPIAEVVQGALTARGQSGAGRIRPNGPNVMLGARSALALALALHELATNAAKYGALSNASGVVDLRWHILHDHDAPRFCLTWTEQGGPAILAPPTRRGFGSRLIERSFAAEVNGEVKLS